MSALYGTYKVMFVDDEDFIRAMLVEYFRGKFDMIAVESAAAAFDVLKGERYDLVVSDVCMPEMNGPEFLAELQRRHPGVKRALLTSSNIDEYVMFANENAVSSIIPKTVPFNYGEIERIIVGLLTGDIFGMGRYLRQNEGEITGKFCVKSTAEARAVRDLIVTGLEKKLGEADDLKLTLDEILMNAIYHAPTGDDGAEKYAQFADVELEPNEYVNVEFGYDSEKYAVSVLDHCGMLTREKVLSTMARQISGEGYMDNAGRGLHICRLFADRMIINIERGRRTEVIIMNYLGGKYRGFKPVYINEV